MSSSNWLTIGVIVLVVARFLFRELRVRRIKSSRIFIVPIIVGLVGALVIVSVVLAAPNQELNLIVGGLIAIVVGAGVGFAVGHFTTVQVQQPGLLIVRGSWITVAIWIGALALRLLARAFVSGGTNVVYTDAASAGGPSLMLNAVLLILLVSALTTVRIRILMTARNEPPGAARAAL
jgi:hypothetical protein